MRPPSLDPTEAMLQQMRGDAYPPSGPGLARAVLELVPRVETAHCVTIGPGRAILWITMRRPWWQILTCGLLAWRCRRAARRVINRYAAAGCASFIEIRTGR